MNLSAIVSMNRAPYMEKNYGAVGLGIKTISIFYFARIHTNVKLLVFLVFKTDFYYTQRIK